jgi:hypothetical protein
MFVSTLTAAFGKLHSCSDSRCLLFTSLDDDRTPPLCTKTSLAVRTRFMLIVPMIRCLILLCKSFKLCISSSDGFICTSQHVDAEELENKDVQLYLYYLDKFAEVKNLRRVENR